MYRRSGNGREHFLELTLKDRRTQTGEGESRGAVDSLVTGGQSECGNRKGQAGRASGREVGSKLFLVGVRLDWERP